MEEQCCSSRWRMSVPREIDPLMGRTGARDMGEVQLAGDSKDEVIAYAEG